MRDASYTALHHVSFCSTLGLFWHYIRSLEQKTMLPPSRSFGAPYFAQNHGPHSCDHREQK